MSDEKKKYSTSDVLENLVIETKQQDKVSIGELKMLLKDRGFDILMIIAALPMCIPIPVPPGYTTFFSIPLFIFAWQMLMGSRSVWLPKWINKKEIKRTTAGLLVEKASPSLRFIERFSRPRALWMLSKQTRRILGFIVMVLTVSIALPLPLTNLLPAWGIVIMCIGSLNRDGLLSLIGVLIGIAGVAVTLLVLYGGVELINSIF